jgi:RNA polymerase sigma-70 factor (ECF subfamily)
MDGRVDERTRIFETTTLPYLNALYGFGRLLTGKQPEAEDLVQETYLRAFLFFHQYNPGTNCKAWLFTIMKHIFLNKRARDDRNIVLAETDDHAWESWDQRIQDRNDTATADRRRTGEPAVYQLDIQRALDTLPPLFRTIVVLRDLEGFSYKEIAVMLDCPIGTIMSRLSRARELLRHALRDYAEKESYRANAMHVRKVESYD